MNAALQRAKKMPELKKLLKPAAQRRGASLAQVAAAFGVALPKSPEGKSK